MTDTERGDWGSEEKGGIGVLSFELQNRLLLCDTRYEVQVAEGFCIHPGTQWVETGILGLLSERL